jgi:RNA polymerase sigma factor (sigma-70 family)
LYRAAINGSLDLVRRRRHESELPAGAEMLSGLPGPERMVSSSELRGWLRRALGDLSTRSAEIFVLRYVEGCDNREIARVMNTSRAVVAVVLHQARAKLSRQLRSFQEGKS